MNVVASFVITAFYAQRAGLYDEAAAACNADGKDTRSQSEKDSWSRHHLAASEKVSISIAASVVIQAAVLVLMAGAFLLFFPACIVMFRRVERRLDAIIQEMALRSDVGNVLLPYEFSPEAADGTRVQEEMQVVEARAFLGRMKSAAAAQRVRFLLCLVLVLLALVALASESLFFSIYSFGANQSSSCGPCETCQSVFVFMKKWGDNAPEVIPLVVSTCSTLPLLFSLWLMMTKEDRAMMLHPHIFRTDAIALKPEESEVEVRLKAERVRMGVELR